MKTVEIYTTGWCPYCIAAKRLLERKGVGFTEIDIGGQPDLREEMMRRAGGRRTVPQIFAGGQYVGDCDGIHLLERQGQLDAALAG